VLNLRQAAKQLPEKVGDLTSNARMRADELAMVTERVATCNAEIDSLVCASREELRRKIEQVQSGLLAEEMVLTKEVERCFSEVASILQIGDDGFENSVRVAEASLRRSHKIDEDAIEALNAFSRLKSVLHSLPPPKRRNISAMELKIQLEQSFKSRLASINSLSTQIDSLWVAQEEQIPIADSKQRFTFGGFELEAENDYRRNELPTTPRFAAAIGGFSPEQDMKEPLMVLPLPQRSLGQASRWANPARFGS
jgi:hypothetical protein